MRTYRNAFTLIELLVVISIIALLASVVLANLNSAREKARIGAGRQFEASMFHVAADSAMGLWDFEECTGSSTADGSGNGATGSFVGGVIFTSATPTGTGCSIQLNGTTGYVSAGTNRPVPLSVSAWIWIDPTSPTDERDIFTNWGSGGSNNMVFKTSGKVLSVYANGFGEAFGASQVFDTGKWYHVAYVNNADGAHSKLYIDGKEAASATATTLGTGTNNWLIGANDNGTARFWKGMIDSVHIFSKTLTAQQIHELYAQEAPRHAVAEAR